MLNNTVWSMMNREIMALSTFPHDPMAQCQFNKNARNLEICLLYALIMIDLIQKNHSPVLSSFSMLNTKI
jgi:hypothetical protein